MPCQEIRPRDVTEPHHLWLLGLHQRSPLYAPTTSRLGARCPATNPRSTERRDGVPILQSRRVLDLLDSPLPYRFNGRGVVPVVTVTSTSCRIGCGPDAALPVPCPTYILHTMAIKPRPTAAPTLRTMHEQDDQSPIMAGPRQSAVGAAVMVGRRPPTHHSDPTLGGMAPRDGGDMHVFRMYYPSTLSDLASPAARTTSMGWMACRSPISTGCHCPTTM
ncbi:hypothetical protein BT67DRAFT_249615 [Trichocladium antarcticum]|uniref:Uncharacterized protein n=1 Tax=Trichocladium antarcticum TaxID=1450529 RepID=A0AAN6ZA86_9PEZI|nr:hypothetical protein BT67DRAFT_249615 [Trichocladium antarcticum]